MLIGFWFIVVLTAGVALWQTLRDRRNRQQALKAFQRSSMQPVTPYVRHDVRVLSPSATARTLGTEANSPG